MSLETKVIKSRLGLLSLAEELGNVSRACKYLGYSRETFYRYKDLFDEGGEQALKDMSRRVPNVKNRIDAHIEERVVAFAIENPAFGQTRASNELKKEGLFVSPCGVRCVWLRHELETFPKRLKALEAKVAQEGLILTESQVVALEKAKEEKVAHGEIETHHPGFLGAQDTYYVVYIKGVGKIYQQTFIDTYSKVAAAKLYDRKLALVAADMLNDRVIPMYDQYGIPLMRILTEANKQHMGQINDNAKQLDYTQFENLFLKSGTLAQYKKKENFVCQYEASKFIGFVKSGIFRYIHIDSNCNQHILGYNFAGDYICDYPSMIKPTDSMTTIQAATDCVVYLLSKRELDDYFETSMDTQRFGRMITEKLLLEMYSRILSFYCETPEQRYIALLRRYPDILQYITLKEIASFIGVTPETVSHIRKRLL